MSDSVIESMSAAESYLQSESAVPEGGPRASRIGSLLRSLGLFGNRGPGGGAAPGPGSGGDR
ncbi:MAG: hypothetical protein J7480_03785 [Microbacteriaceae bacterium]|nr:hypothetical protein [Microbacteriaceae bacterium]